jgi:predicted nucleic acid-binding protein
LRILVDTSVWVGYFGGIVSRETDYLHNLLGQGYLETGDLIAAEVLARYTQPDTFATVRDALDRFYIHPLGGRENALAAADLTRRLRADHHVPTPNVVDSLIAAFCLRMNLVLLHADPAFEPFEEHLGLRPALPRRVG